MSTIITLGWDLISADDFAVLRVLASLLGIG